MYLRAGAGLTSRLVIGRLSKPLVLALALLAAAVPAPATAVGLPPAKRVRIPFPRYDGTLTPYTFELGYPLVTLIYDTLMWRDARGVPSPWLARSVERRDGGRRLKIRLRRGVRWHDGRALTSADVAFTFSFVASHFHPRFTPELSDVRAVRAPDRLTVTIDLRRPSLGFLDQPLSDMPILPRHIWEGLDPGRLAPRGPTVGSGPYRLVRATPIGGYSLRANRSYFRGRPRVERIEVPIIGDAERTYGGLEGRKLDMVPISLPEDAVQRVGASFGLNLARGPDYSGTALQLNLRRPPFGAAAARRAVASALDLERILRHVGPGVTADRGYIHPASRWAPRAILHRFDAGGARRALRRLHLRPIAVLAARNDQPRLEGARQVVLALRRAGAEARLVTLSPERLGRAIGEDGGRPSFEAAVTSTPPLASFDPDYLRLVFGGRGRREAPLNHTGYRSARFERLADQVAGAPTRAARRRAIGRELRLLARDVPAVPLFFSEGTFAYRPAVYDGWLYMKGAGILDKRSFLPGSSSTRRAGVEASEPEGSADSGAFLDVLRIVALVALAGALALAAWALLARRRSG